MKNDKIQISSQSEKSGQPMREHQTIPESLGTIFLPSHWRKQFTGIQREKKSGLRTKMKSFHNGYSDQEVRIKVYPF